MTIGSLNKHAKPHHLVQRRAQIHVRRVAETLGPVSENDVENLTGRIGVSKVPRPDSLVGDHG